MSGLAVLSFYSDMVARLTTVFPRPCASAHASTRLASRNAKPSQSAAATRAGSAGLPHPPFPRRLLPRESRAMENAACNGESAAAKTAVAAAYATTLTIARTSQWCSYISSETFD